MSAPGLESRYRLSLARFADDGAGRSVLDGLGRFAREVQELLIHIFGHDVALLPADLDREHVKTVMLEFLPGRLDGKEPYRRAMPDVLEAYLRFLALDEGLGSSWELTSGVDEHRDLFAERLADPARRRYGSAIASAPDKRPAPKIGRNDPCFCGSGKKYKNCCLRLLDG